MKLMHRIPIPKSVIGLLRVKDTTHQNRIKSPAIGRNGIKHLALALALGAGLGAGSVQAQAILEVGGAGVIGVTTLTTANVPAGANWTAAGGEGFKYSSLISPPVTVTANGPVTLKFNHR